MANRKIRARYHVRKLGKQKITYNKCGIDPDTKSLTQETVTEEFPDCYMVSFPQGHSIRVTSFERLKELGYHVKPRMVDMETGETVDFGGDEYDFANQDDDVIVMDDDEGPKPASRKTIKENA